MIDIIIPMYNCIDTIESTLMSICMQNNKELLNVILIDDCSSCDYYSILNKYNNLLNISYYKLDKNSGPGIARQYGIDHSNSPYIMFIDADDLLYTADSVISLYNEINDGLDYVSALTYNEYVGTTASNSGDLHGKIYRRDFIIKNNIKFNDSRFHEDNLFNSLVLLHDPLKKSYEKIVYIYSYNKKSLTKSNEAEEFNRTELYIKNMSFVIDVARNDKCKTELIDNYINKKYNYLKNIYKDLNESNRKILNTWLKENNLEEISI